MYKFFNANKNGRFVNDCVVRAIAVAEDKPWSQVYDELSAIAKEKGILLDDVNFVEPLLDSKYKRYCNRNIKVGEFVENNKIGTFLVTMNGHITCVKERCYIRCLGLLRRNDEMCVVSIIKYCIL